MDAAVPAGASGAHDAGLLLGLFLIFGAAKLMAELFERLRQPAVVGEILAGVLIGPSCFGWVSFNDAVHLLSELGVIFLLFSIGLETRPRSLFGVGGMAMTVAVLGVVLPLGSGYVMGRALGSGMPQALFLGAAMVATSVGITARTLGGLGVLATRSARVVLGAAVIDDVLGLLVLAAVTSLAAGRIDVVELGLSTLLALGFIAAMALIAAPVLTRAAPHVGRLRSANAEFALAVALCLGIAAAGLTLGVAAIIGAFLAGMALAEAGEERHDLRAQVRGVTELLTPFFLVGVGLQIDLRSFAEPSTLAFGVLLTAVAIVTKLLGCGLGALKLGPRGALQVGVGMIPRGEVGIVVAQLGLSLGVIDARGFGAVLMMVCATTLLAPPLLRPLYRGTAPAD